MRKALALSALVAAAAAAPDARAFCGFYVAGADQKLHNEATMVVLMREGTRTVLAMQNDYAGPPQKFAMVVPVPVVLQKENVRTLAKDLFDKIDQLSSPRLVEYWEQDPCAPPIVDMAMSLSGLRGAAGAGAGLGGMPADDLGVTIEAQFAVGEYEIVILGAQDSAGLDTWLHREGYHIPDGAEPLLRPYVEAGSKFFVAKVDVTKVAFAPGGHAMLSPLRFHYDDAKFELPIRLGLLNSAGTQDLVVHVLSSKRYEVANYPNVTIPTNLDVAESARDKFASVYAKLFDETIARNPRAVVTEYAWSSSSCDPCPGPTLSAQDLMSLGGDALPASGPPRGSVQMTEPQDADSVLRANVGRAVSDCWDDWLRTQAMPAAGDKGPEGTLVLTLSVAAGAVKSATTAGSALPNAGVASCAAAAVRGSTASQASGEATIASTKVTGQVSNAEAVIRSQLHPRARACYRRALQMDPTTEGHVHLTINVGASGDVDSVTAAETTSVASCIRGAARGLQFGPPEGGSATIALTVDLTRTGGANEKRTIATKWRLVSGRPPPSTDMVLTRMHARYAKDALGDDLVFRPAGAIVGGREFVVDAGALERGARADATNNFQARYAIRHAWTGAIACDNPRRGVWGGPPADAGMTGLAGPSPKPARNLAFADRKGIDLGAFFVGDPWTSVGGAVVAAPGATVVAASDAEAASDGGPPVAPVRPRGCGGCATSPSNGAACFTIGALATLALLRRRR